MKIEYIVGEKLSSSIEEVREDTESYEQVVFLSKDMDNWNRILTEKLGPPLISAEEMGNEVLAEDLAFAMKEVDSFGGIQKGQTLYYGMHETSKIIITLWPWQDGKQVTLNKVII